MGDVGVGLDEKCGSVRMWNFCMSADWLGVRGGGQSHVGEVGFGFDEKCGNVRMWKSSFFVFFVHIGNSSINIKRNSWADIHLSSLLRERWVCIVQVGF